MAHEKDKATKKLEDHADVFADILNVLLFGKPLIKPEFLKAGPTESIYKAEGLELYDQRRDTLKEYMDNSRFLLATFGMENQSKIEKFMPVRVFGYDYGSYRQQILDGETSLRPVITIVLNFSMKRWGVKKSLHDIMKIPPELKAYVSDYTIKVFDIAFLPDDVIDAFTSDFKVVAKFFRAKRLGNNNILNNETVINHVEEVMDMLSVFSNESRYRDQTMNLLAKQSSEGEVRMCDFLQSILDEGKIEGMIEGRIHTISEFLSNGGTEADAKRFLKATDEELQKAKEMCATTV